MFDIDLTKKYGILLSGGLDSALLLSLIVKYYPTINIQPFTIPKHDGASLYVDNIISHINIKCNTNIPKTIYVGNPDAPHRRQGAKAIVEVFRKHNVDFLFNGITQNPPELNDDPSAPKRPKKQYWYRVPTPFIEFRKDKVLELMYENELEYLMELTHSCTEQQEGRCNVCWQCQERAWAFTKLNKLDKGTL